VLSAPPPELLDSPEPFYLHRDVLTEAVKRLPASKDAYCLIRHDKNHHGATLEYLGITGPLLNQTVSCRSRDTLPFPDVATWCHLARPREKRQPSKQVHMDAKLLSRLTRAQQAAERPFVTLEIPEKASGPLLVEIRSAKEQTTITLLFATCNPQQTIPGA
jgi:hypothetical protein